MNWCNASLRLMRMLIKIKNKTRLEYFGLTVLTMVFLTLFCYVTRISFIIPLLLLFSGMHLFYFRKANPKLFINLGLLLALIIFLANAFLEYNLFPRFYIPVAGIAILTMLLYNDLQLAFIMSVVSSVSVGLVIGNDFNLMLVFFIGSLMGIYSVKDIRTRGDLMKAGFFTGIIQVVCGILLNPVRDVVLTKGFSVDYLLPLFLNAYLAVGLVMFTLKIFEWAFGVLTNFSLLELSDFNQPLLKQMILEAPGTYHHSLVVSNLAEAAANAIEANALLTRVGAYYHDIGKMVKPEYFAENQLIDRNKHDVLGPSISRLIILNHVKEGMELAKKHNLNQRIVDFIPQHHGTSLMHYFYQRALEEAAQDEKVDEQNFRYSGPKPQSRETAIVLLADSVEGAVRALEDRTPVRIAELARKVINNKFIDGQLDECELTLKDLDKISETFTRVLSALYHSRVKYPERKNGNGHIDNKSPEENSHQPQSNHQGRGKNPAT